MENGVIILNADGIERPKSKMDYETVRSVIYEKPEYKKVAILVQAYGRIEKTRACIEHILNFTQDISFRLILLDNGSEEKEIMSYFESVDYPEKTIVRATKNISAVYALNKVMQMVDTKYSVIVNNDVLVTPGWLNNLLKCADSDPKIGMVCPVSTNVSCGQEEDLGGFDTVEEMIAKAKEYNISNPAKWEERLRMIPTVALYRSEIFEVAGLYDVGFIHDWGDDDYTFRVRHAGYKLILCRDTFVHHNHNVRESEDKDPVEADNLARSGRAIFRQRHHGIDSWDDTNDTIAPILKKASTDKIAGSTIKSLSIDCKCGAMVLDVRNFYRRFGIYNIHTTVLINDVKYYNELQSVADEVLWGTLTEAEEKSQYDFIAIGKPINKYADPLKTIEKAYKMLDEDGVVVFNLLNSASYRQFLYCLGHNNLREKELFGMIYREEIIEKIVQMEGEIQNIFPMYHRVNDEIKRTTEDIMQGILQGEISDDKDNLLSNLFVKNFWFMVKKPSIARAD